MAETLNENSASVGTTLDSDLVPANEYVKFPTSTVLLKIFLFISG